MSMDGYATAEDAVKVRNAPRLAASCATPTACVIAVLTLRLVRVESSSKVRVLGKRLF